MLPRVIFVDDDPEILASYRRVYLDRLDIQVFTDPQAALAAIVEWRSFVVVVADRVMPGLDGLEFLKRVKEKAPHTHRILLTGYLDLALAESGREEAAVHRVLVKPCLPDALAEAVREGWTSRERPA